MKLKKHREDIKSLKEWDACLHPIARRYLHLIRAAENGINAYIKYKIPLDSLKPDVQLVLKDAGGKG